MPHTPRLDAWREQLRAATAARGAKTALARHMAHLRGQDIQVWRVGIGRILNGNIIPNGEDVLEISAWMEAQNTPTNHGRHRPPRPAGTHA